MTTNRPTAVFITGLAGTGKSFFAKRISMLTGIGVVSKDYMTMAVVEEMNKVLGLNENDRESPLYQTLVRPFEYGAVLTETIKRLNEGKSVIVDAPFLNEIATAGGMDSLRDVFDEQGHDIIFVWMDHGIDATKVRLENRGYPRDNWKLSNWTEYTRNIKSITIPYEHFDFVVRPENLEDKVVQISDLFNRIS